MSKGITPEQSEYIEWFRQWQTDTERSIENGKESLKKEVNALDQGVQTFNKWCLEHEIIA